MKTCVYESFEDANLQIGHNLAHEADGSDGAPWQVASEEAGLCRAGQ